MAATLENAQAYNTSPIIQTVYADNSYQAKVNGDYPGYFKFSSGSEVWIVNTPSLIWNNTGSVNLLSTGTYFVVNKQANLPYKLDSLSVIQNKDGNQIMQVIAGTGAATLTGVNITNITTATGVSGMFTGSLLASFGGNLPGIQTMILGNGSTGITSQTYTNCTGTTQSGYIITPLTHGQTLVFNKSITGGTGSLSTTCTNGTLSYGSESMSC